jgi:hypothetical protein
MSDQRNIDKLRNSAFQMSIGDGDESLEEHLKIGDNLYILTKNKIYQLILADSIDPKRTNNSVPNTYTEILDYGTGNKVIGQILLTAKQLLGSNLLDQSIDWLYFI